MPYSTLSAQGKTEMLGSLWGTIVSEYRFVVESQTFTMHVTARRSDRTDRYILTTEGLFSLHFDYESQSTTQVMDPWEYIELTAIEVGEPNPGSPVWTVKMELWETLCAVRCRTFDVRRLQPGC